jgi:hypothetical protein
MLIPKEEKKLVQFATNVKDDCQVSLAKRVTAYRAYGQWVEMGRAAGGLALANLLYGHLDRLASHLFSPSELRFVIDYENAYPKEWLDKGTVAARVVSRDWETKNVDMLFGHGVMPALTYGAYFMKQIADRTADGGVQFKGARLVGPWAFGVYDESSNALSEQEAFCETVYINKHEVWRRIRNLPDAERLYKRVLGNAKKEEGVGVPQSFMHQVLSTATLNTSLNNMMTPTPGGIVQLTNDPTYAALGPQVQVDLYPMHEIWIKDDSKSGDDYTTIQLFEPDIIVAPIFKHINLFVPEAQPYTLIQPNFEPGYFWGRSEITDLMALQSWLTEHLDDAKRLMGQQVDKLLGFIGWDGVTDEIYGQSRSQGYMSLPMGADIKDMTPKMPDQLIPMISEIIQLMDRVSGFPPIMGGQGEPGVRAGVHADTLMKTGSPRLRDRSLLVERQCASAADITLTMLEAKDARAYWTDPLRGETDFLLSQLPDDRRIAVDSHSSSPIYSNDHQQLIAWGVQHGVLGPEDAIDDLPFAHKDQKRQRLKDRQAQHAELVREHPEILTHQKPRRAA